MVKLHDMTSPDKTKLINAGVLAGFALALSGFVVDSNLFPSLGYMLLGLIFVIYNQELATERFRIDKETKSELLKKYLYSQETIGRNRFVIRLVGLGFLVGGSVSLFASLSL